ncbi:MAG: GNAT family N-acetyltransferase [Candidatus Eisenbacteria bacterium]
MLKPLAARHAGVAYAFLTAHGLRDVFLASKIESGALALPDGAAQGRFVGAFDGDRLDGVLFLGHGGLVVFASDLPHVRRRFAELTWEERARVRLIVGEWTQVSDFWSHLTAAGLESTRDWREVFMEATPASLGPAREPALRLATPADVAALGDLSARAYLEETGLDPLASMGEGYLRHVAKNIEEGGSYVLEDSGRLVFKADLSARCAVGAQIVGVFTEPDRRGEGIAGRGVAELVHRLTDPAASGEAAVPAVCLFVREDNVAARRAYERAGFLPSMHYRRLFVEPASTRRGAAATSGATPAARTGRTHP